MPFYQFGSPVFVPSTSPNSIGVGVNALADDTTGASNVAVGAGAGGLITTGANNVVIGPAAASTNLATGSNNIIVGTSNAADTAAGSTSNTLWIGGGSTAIMSAVNINATPTVTIPGGLTVQGPLTHTGGSVQAPVAAGSTLAVTSAMAGATILLNTAAGSTCTLPAATGSGSSFTFVVSTTASSNAHKVLAASVSDFLNGLVTGENAGTAKCFASAAATNHSLQMPFAGTQPSGGFIGDWFTVTDIGTNLWTVRGAYQAGTTPTTPFSAATT